VCVSPTALSDAWAALKRGLNFRGRGRQQQTAAAAGDSGGMGDAGEGGEELMAVMPETVPAAAGVSDTSAESSNRRAEAVDGATSRQGSTSTQSDEEPTVEMSMGSASLGNNESQLHSPGMGQMQLYDTGRVLWLLEHPGRGGRYVLVEVPPDAVAELVITGRNMSDHVPDNYLEALRSATSHVTMDSTLPPPCTLTHSLTLTLARKSAEARNAQRPSSNSHVSALKAVPTTRSTPEKGSQKDFSGAFGEVIPLLQCGARE
jgi:hypothetical protein